MVQRIVLVLLKPILRISAKRNQKYLIEDVIILSNNNGNRMVRLLVTAVDIPEDEFQPRATNISSLKTSSYYQTITEIVWFVLQISQ